jgi:hypothetical protein
MTAAAPANRPVANHLARTIWPCSSGSTPRTLASRASSASRSHWTTATSPMMTIDAQKISNRSANPPRADRPGTANGVMTYLAVSSTVVNSPGEISTAADSAAWRSPPTRSTDR